MANLAIQFAVKFIFDLAVHFNLDRDDYPQHLVGLAPCAISASVMAIEHVDKLHDTSLNVMETGSEITKALQRFAKRWEMASRCFIAMRCAQLLSS